MPFSFTKPKICRSILRINLSGLPQFIPMITSGRVDRDSQPQNLQVSDKGTITSLIEAFVVSSPFTPPYSHQKLSITSILISRSILELREDYVEKGQDSGSSLHIEDMSFRVNPQTLDLYSSDERRCDLENCRSDKLSRPVRFEWWDGYALTMACRHPIIRILSGFLVRCYSIVIVYFESMMMSLFIFLPTA